MGTASRMSGALSMLAGVILFVLLGGCGSDDGVKPPTSQTGVFLDSPVAGLSYTTNSTTGLTNSQGEFVYRPGESVTFQIGGIILGQGKAERVMTPVSLVEGAEDEENPTVTNIVRFLLTLDNDANPENSIEISDAVREAAAGKAVNFEQTPEAFGSDVTIRDLIAELTSLTQAGARELVSSSDAQAHLRKTLLGIYCGTYAGTYSGDDRGTWTVDIDANGTLLGSGVSYDGTQFDVQGDVTSAGSVNFIGGVVSIGDVYFFGTITYDGKISGTWQSYTYSISGTFSGSRTTGCNSFQPGPPR